MEPIISPWVIYAVHVMASIHDLFCGLLVFNFVGMFISVVIVFTEEDEKFLKTTKILAVITAVNIIIVMIIPGKDIILAMLAASYITPDNAQLVQGNIVDFVKQISEAVQNCK